MDEIIKQHVLDVLQELYSGWSETNDAIRQRDGHPPADHTNVLVSYLQHDIERGLITLHFTDESLLAKVGPDVATFLRLKR